MSEYRADSHRFAEAVLRATTDMSGEGGIGTLSERLLHKSLKYYFEPCEQNHEVAHLGSVADIKNNEGVIEIQTRAFDRLVAKLGRFLPEGRVTVVYPIIYEKTLVWCDRQSGELSAPRKSPRRGRPSDALPELSKIESFIGHKNLTVLLVFVNAEEYKSLDGWDKSRKRGATKIDRIPKEIVRIIELKEPSDLADLIPDGLSAEFYAKDFYRATALRSRRAYFSLKLLLNLGLLERKKGEHRAYIYKRK